MKAYTVKITITWPSGKKTYFLTIGEGEKSNPYSLYTVTMMPLPDTTSKIPLIKELRRYMQLGLKEAVNLVDNAPSVLAKDISLEEANTLARVIRPWTEVKIIAN